MGKFNKNNLEIVKKLTEEGKSSREISEIIGEPIPRIDYYRSKYKWPSRYVRSKIYHKLDLIKDLVNKGYTDFEIAEQIGCCEETIRKFRIKHNIIRPNYRFSKEINISDTELEILVGTLLGDSSLIAKNTISARFCCEHSCKQKEYVEHLYKVLPNLNLSLKHRIVTNSIKLESSCSPTLYNLYSKFYVNNVKIIPEIIFNNFTERSLAYLFMDDGCAYKHKNSLGIYKIKGFEIATCCFTVSDLEKFKNFLNSKFDLHFKIGFHYNKYYDKKYPVLRLNSCDITHFTELVSPYIIDSLKYKIQDGS